MFLSSASLVPWSRCPYCVAVSPKSAFPRETSMDSLPYSTIRGFVSRKDEEEIKEPPPGQFWHCYSRGICFLPAQHCRWRHLPHQLPPRARRCHGSSEHHAQGWADWDHTEAGEPLLQLRSNLQLLLGIPKNLLLNLLLNQSQETDFFPQHRGGTSSQPFVMVQGNPHHTSPLPPPPHTPGTKKGL